MLFNSGYPNLFKHTSHLAGDRYYEQPDYFKQDIKDAINIAYDALRAIAMQFGSGTANKRSYATTVADQIFYENPSDLVRLLSVEVETGGNDLSTTDIDAANIAFYEPSSEDEAMAAYNTGNLNGRALFFMHDDHFGIVGPPSSVGSNAMRITYQASTTHLSADTDEPVIPRPHHELICYRAAVALCVGSKLMDGISMLKFEEQQRFSEFVASMQNNMAAHDHQMPVAGLLRPRTGRLPKFGTKKRTG